MKNLSSENKEKVTWKLKPNKKLYISFSTASSKQKKTTGKENVMHA